MLDLINVCLARESSTADGGGSAKSPLGLGSITTAARRLQEMKRQHEKLSSQCKVPRFGEHARGWSRSDLDWPGMLHLWIL
jgi:hypothetical protein